MIASKEMLNAVETPSIEEMSVDSSFQLALRMPSPEIEIVQHHSTLDRVEIWERLARYAETNNHPARNLAWLNILKQAFGHRVFVLEAVQRGETVGVLPLAEVRSILFGKYLVSLPYLNQGGFIARDGQVAKKLIDEATRISDALDVRYLELRHEDEVIHPKLTHRLGSKVQMRLALPSTPDALWSQFKSKLRSQIRSGESHGFTVHWGGLELLDDFYTVFSRNMRDLGTPVFGKNLFREILEQFPGDAELCCVRAATKPIATALLIHSREVTEVPSASSLRAFHSENPNMVMYWNLLQRAILRGNRVFDFGRSTIDAGTYRFKRQWGATSSPAIWQYYVRKGRFDAMRPGNGKFSLAVRIWKRLPVALTRCIGPSIVRGIP
jgi:serine/alanine adding enzyme